MTDPSRRTIDDIAQEQQSQANYLDTIARRLANLQQSQEQQALMARLSEGTPMRVGAYPSGADIAPAGSTSPGASNIFAPDSITGSDIAARSISAAEIVVGTITADEIAGSTITGDEIANYAITGGKIANTTITAGNIATGTITANEIAADTITADQINSGTISTIELNAASIAVDTITAGDIFGTTITGLNFVAGGGDGTQISVLDSGSSEIGYWDGDGLHVVDGKFFMANVAVRISTSNSNSFWDFTGRAVRGTHGLVTFVSSGASSDGDMSNMTINGSIGVSDSGRIYYRYGGGWHYSSQTAGFEIPVHEVICPVCELPLLPGQDFIGRGDRVRTDGSLHALYIHFGCAGTPMNMTIADEYDAVGNHADLDADPVGKDKHQKLVDRLTRKARKALGLDEAPAP